MSTDNDESLLISSALVKHKNGFSFDFGGSAIKIVHAVEEYDHVRLSFTTFANENIDDAIGYLKERLTNQNSEGQVICTTGVGSSQYQELLRSSLGITTENLLEVDCFARGFVFLAKNFTLPEIVHPTPEAVTKFAQVGAQEMMATMTKWHDNFDSGAKPWEMDSERGPGAQDHNVSFPAIVVSCGSAAGAMTVFEDGRVDMLDMTSCSGRFFLGLGSLLTGAETFDELVSLAEKGDARKVDVTSDQLQTTDGDVYDAFKIPLPLFAFGHAPRKQLGDFAKEDLAAALVSHVAQHLGQFFLHWSMLQKIPHVFFCGGFSCTKRLLREEIGKHFARGSLINNHGFFSQEYFVRLGSYLGCLGALLKGLQLENISHTDESTSL